MLLIPLSDSTYYFLDSTNVVVFLFFFFFFFQVGTIPKLIEVLRGITIKIIIIIIIIIIITLKLNMWLTAPKEATPAN